MTWQKTFVSRVISKTPYSHFRTHSISIVENYKWAIWNYKWNTISFWKTEKLVKLMLNKSQCIHMWLHWLLQISNFTRQKNLWNWCWTKVNVLTCDYIDFCLAHVTTLTVIYKIYENCAITFNLHGKLFYSVATIVVFNNAKCWGVFGNHRCRLWTSLLAHCIEKPTATSEPGADIAWWDRSQNLQKVHERICARLSSSQISHCRQGASQSFHKTLTWHATGISKIK